MIEKKELIDGLQTALSVLSSMQENLEELKHVISDTQGKHDYIVSKTILGKLGAKDDVKLIEKIQTAIDALIKSNIVTKIEENLPVMIPTDPKNPNIMVVTGIISNIIKLAYDLPLILSYYVDYYYMGNKNADYIKYVKNLTETQYSIVEFLSVITDKNVKELESALFNLPTPRDMDSVPTSLFNSYISKFIKASSIKKYVLNIINVFKTTKSNFVGNPIYHMLKLLADFEVNRYQSLKDRKKYLELKIMELKMKQNGEDSEKVRKMLDYYEKELAKTEAKIKAIESEYNK